MKTGVHPKRRLFPILHVNTVSAPSQFFGPSLAWASWAASANSRVSKTETSDALTNGAGRTNIFDLHAAERGAGLPHVGSADFYAARPANPRTAQLLDLPERRGATDVAPPHTD